MTQSLKKTCLSALLVGASALTASFAQAQTADPCVAVTIIDANLDGSNRSVTKRLVDYKTEQVITTMAIRASFADGGSAVSVQSKTFAELGATVEARLEKARPAGCPKS